MSTANITLIHGASMPRLGLGTWPMDDADAQRSVSAALKMGYRLVDTAYNYKNETGVGLGLRDSGIDREEVFITSKFNREFHSVQGVAEAFEGSCARLGVTYLDLFLVHWPNPDQDQYVDAWRGLVALWEAGKIRALGVSNFKAEHIDRILEATQVVPDLNQVEFSPHIVRNSIRAYDAEHGIVTQSWSPIARGGELFDEPVIAEIAAAHNATKSQVVLAWHLALGLAVVPKSSDPSRMAENLAALELQLTGDEIAAITALDRGEQHAVDSDAFGH